MIDVIAKGDGSLMLASVGVRDTDTKSGNPWHDPRTGQFANAPPGVKLLRGLTAMSRTSGKTKAFIEKRRQFTLPDSMAAAEVEGDNVKVLFFREGELVDEFTVARDIDKAKLNQKLKERAGQKAHEIQQSDEDAVEKARQTDALIKDLAEALDSMREPEDPFVHARRPLDSDDPRVADFERFKDINGGAGDYDSYDQLWADENFGLMEQKLDGADRQAMVDWRQGHTREQDRALTSLMLKNRDGLREDVVVWRGSRSPTGEGVGEGNPSDVSMSTSLSKHTALGYADPTGNKREDNLRRVLLPAGSRVAYNQGEREVILPIGTRLEHVNNNDYIARLPDSHIADWVSEPRPAATEPPVTGYAISSIDPYSFDNHPGVQWWQGRMRVNLDVASWGNIKSATFSVDSQDYYEAKNGEDAQPWFTLNVEYHDGSMASDSFEQFHDAESEEIRKSMYLLNAEAPTAKPPPEPDDPELEFPKRLTQGWLEKVLPTLDEAGAKKLIEALRKKGWGDRPGSLTDRVYPHLSPEVQEALGVKPAEPDPRPPTFDRDVNSLSPEEVDAELEFFRTHPAFQVPPMQNPEEVRERIRGLNRRKDVLDIQELDAVLERYMDEQVLAETPDQVLEELRDRIERHENRGIATAEQLNFHQVIIDELNERYFQRRQLERDRIAKEREAIEEEIMTNPDAKLQHVMDAIKHAVDRIVKIEEEKGDRPGAQDKDDHVKPVQELVWRYIRANMAAHDLEGEDSFVGELRVDWSGFEVGAAWAHMDWRGNIVFGSPTWHKLEDFLVKMRVEGATLTADEAQGFKVLLHEAQHAVVAEDKRNDLARQYQLPSGKLIEEALTEVSARHDTMRLLKLLGRDVGGKPMSELGDDTMQDPLFIGSYSAEVGWLNEVFITPMVKKLMGVEEVEGDEPTFVESRDASDVVGSGKSFPVIIKNNSVPWQRNPIGARGKVVGAKVDGPSGLAMATVKLERGDVISVPLRDLRKVSVTFDPNGLDEVTARDRVHDTLKKIHWNSGMNLDRLVAMHAMMEEQGLDFDPQGDKGRVGHQRLGVELMQQFKAKVTGEPDVSTDPKIIINAIDTEDDLKRYIKVIMERRLAAKKSADSFEAAGDFTSAKIARGEQRRWNGHLTHAKARLAFIQKGGTATTAVTATEADPRVATPEEIKALKIPPAWKDVMIFDTPTKGGLKAYGFDAKGRKQYRYDADVVARKSQAKFERVQVVAKKADKIVKQMRADAPGNDTAAALLLIALSGFRVGSDADTGAKVKAFGATTLRAEHLRIEGDKMHFDFIGKKGVRITQTVEDKLLADLLRDREGRLFDTTNTRVRAYLQRQQKGFLPKDFRTHTANLEASRILASLPMPHTAEQAEKLKMLVARGVAAKLGNTPNVALSNYIDPRIFSAWEVDLPGTAMEAPALDVAETTFELKSGEREALGKWTDATWGPALSRALRYYDSLNEEERERAFTDPFVGGPRYGSFDLEKMRGGEFSAREPDLAMLSKIVKAVNRNSFTEDTEVWRGIGPNEYPGVEFPSEPEELAKMLEGFSIVDPASFRATTKTRRTAEFHADIALMRIRVSKGDRGLDVSSLSDHEYVGEVLLGGHQRMRFSNARVEVINGKERVVVDVDIAESEPEPEFPVGSLVDISEATGEVGELGVVTRIGENGDAWVTSFNSQMARTSTIQWGNQWLKPVDMPDVVDDGLATVLFDQRYEEWGDGLSEDEFEAWKAWRTDDGTDSINAHLRADGADEEIFFSSKGFPKKMKVSEAIAKMDATIARAPGTPTNSRLTVFRGVTNLDGMLQGRGVGDVFEDKGFIATSTEEDTAVSYSGFDEGGGILKIEVPEGTAGAWMRGNRNIEGVNDANFEFVLPRGSRFEIVSDDPPGTTRRMDRVVTMRLLP